MVARGLLGPGLVLALAGCGGGEEPKVREAEVGLFLFNLTLGAGVCAGLARFEIDLEDGRHRRTHALVLGTNHGGGADLTLAIGGGELTGAVGRPVSDLYQTYQGTTWGYVFGLGARGHDLHNAAGVGADFWQFGMILSFYPEGEETLSFWPLGHQDEPMDGGPR